MDAPKTEESRRSNFIREIIEQDLAANTHQGRVVTRFPPEPNGYPHIGHAKSICLNFGLARDYQGTCHLRFDDTNPTTEDIEYVEALRRDIRWLGFDWGEHEYYASDYFGQLYDFAVILIKKGLAYVCSLTDAQIREYRGSLSEPGRPSPDRDRPIEESLDLFARMRAGEFEEGRYVLRGRIDMGSPNMKMRDPLFYRIRHAHHYRQGDSWPIYPFYDFAHCLSDSIEDITHSICTLEFENNRELYDWIIKETGVQKVPRQYEFARLALATTITSKRKLLQLIKDKLVDGWDDPRMPTLSGMRRRGYTPEAIRDFCDMIGVARANSTVDFEKLEYAVRNDLNHRAPRVMVILDPLKVTITNWPEGKVETLEASYWPHDVPREGSREVPFGGTLFIEREDFMEAPPRGYHRLSPGGEVRLRYGYFLKCEGVVKDAAGEVVELLCTIDPDTRGGSAKDGRKVKGTIHWVSAAHALPIEVRLYDRLFWADEPGAGGRDFLDDLNPDSLTILTAMAEPSMASAAVGDHFQFERTGYFILDAAAEAGRPAVYNRVVTLKDSWARKTATPEPDAAPSPAPEVAVGQEVDSGRGDRRPSRRNRAYERQKAREASPILAERFARYGGELGLGEEEADLLSGDLALSDLFEAALPGCQAQSLARWIVNELLRALKDTPVDALPFGPDKLAALVRMLDAGTINGTVAKEVFEAMMERGADPEQLVKDKGLEQLDDASALSGIVDGVLAESPEELERLRGGDKRLMGLFIGNVMKATGGKANAQLVRQLIQEKI